MTTTPDCSIKCIGIRSYHPFAQFVSGHGGGTHFAGAGPLTGVRNASPVAGAEVHADAIDQTPANLHRSS